MKKILLVCLTFMAASVGYGANAVLNINGEPVEKVVTKVTFDKDNVIVHFSDATSEYDMSEVTFTFAASGIGAVEALQYQGFVGDILTVSGVATDTAVEVYDMNGRKVAQTRSAGDSASLDAGSLAPGVYVLRVENKIVKFVKH